MTKLWAKGNAGEPHPAVNAYIISKNLMADNRLVPFDVRASIAHAQMLAKVGILTKAESEQLTAKLEEILSKHKSGEFALRQESEDVHTEIENYLVKELGPLGKKIHAGRSRNDQVLVAMRLYVKEDLNNTRDLALATAGEILTFARKYEFMPMAGFTHMQHAMPSSVGQWAGSFVESLLNDARILQSTAELLDQNPLGSAAGFGTGVPIDRDETTKRLGFARTQVNSLFCQNSRAKFDALVINALLQVMLTLGKVANDLVIFNSQEFKFFEVDRSLTTGSSIMPQKRNLDIMEVLRANVSIVQSLQFQVQTVGLNLISGYNKDVKICKQAVMDAFHLTQESLKIVALTFTHLTPNEGRLLEAFDDVEIYAADEANRLVAEGMPFRDAYRQVGENLGSLAKQDPAQNIRSKKHLGATGNLGLERLEAELKSR